MKIHSVYLSGTIVPPGRSDRHHYLLSVEAEEEASGHYINSVRYHLEQEQIGLKVYNKDRTKSTLIPWHNVVQVRYMEEKDVKKVASKSA
jgi:hypothetical protein